MAWDTSSWRDRGPNDSASKKSLPEDTFMVLGHNCTDCLFHYFILILQPSGVSSRWHDALINIAKYAGATVVQEYEHHGTQGASNCLRKRACTTDLQACLLPLDGTVILGNGCERFAAAAHSATVSGKTRGQLAPWTDDCGCNGTRSP